MCLKNEPVFLLEVGFISYVSCLSSKYSIIRQVRRVKKVRRVRRVRWLRQICTIRGLKTDSLRERFVRGKNVLTFGIVIFNSQWLPFKTVNIAFVWNQTFSYEKCDQLVHCPKGNLYCKGLAYFLDSLLL
jgi:hypothetical protein